MDPDATWRALIDEWTQGNWLDVYELAESLQSWMEKGGFPPDTVATRAVGVVWNRAAALAVCGLAIRTVHAVMNSPNGIPGSVPFVLSCDTCNNEGPDSYDAAVAAGWTGIRYYPSGLSENVLGQCGACRQRDGDV